MGLLGFEIGVGMERFRFWCALGLFSGVILLSARVDIISDSAM